MKKKEIRKKISSIGARLALNFSFWLVRISPYWLFQGVMQVFAFVWFHSAKRLRKVAWETLTVAFGETKGPQELEAIIHQCFRNITHAMLDLAYYSQHPQKVQERFIIENRHYLDAALQKGKGVVLVTAHFGNFPLMMLNLAQMGYRPSVILRRARDPEIAKKIYQVMERVGVKTIYSVPPRESVKQSLESLRANEILCVLMDQNFGSGSGVFVEFFGRKAATATGPVVFAERTGADVLLAFTVQEEGKYRVIFEPPVKLEEREDQQERLTVNVAKITRIIEDYIRRYPAEWGWMHRRWKSQDATAEQGVSL